MPVHLRDVIGYLDTTLEIERFKDYAPNGLQVEGAPEIEHVVTEHRGDPLPARSVLRQLLAKLAQDGVAHRGRAPPIYKREVTSSALEPQGVEYSSPP